MRTKSLSALVALSFCAFAASAGGLDATVNTGGIHFSLVDLDPNDGIDPAVSITGMGLEARSELWRGSTLVDAQHVVRWTFTPAEVTISGPGYLTSATVMPLSDGLAAATLSASTDPIAGGGSYYFSSANVYALSFSLTPHTGIEASVDVNYDLSVRNDVVPDGVYHSSVTSGMRLSIEEETHYVNEDDQTWHAFLTSPRTRNGSFSSLVSLFNDTAGALAGTVRMETTLTGGAHFVSSAVPEPATSTLLLMGLAVTGAVARRRQRRTA